MLHLHIEVDNLSYSCCSQSNYIQHYTAIEHTLGTNKEHTHTYLYELISMQEGG